jgi:hypothetical protein
VIERAQRVEAGRPAREGWASVFGKGVNSQTGLLRGLGGVAGLVDEIKSDVSALNEDENPKLLLSHMKQFDELVSKFLVIASHTMKESLACVNATGLYSLEVCSGALNRHQPATVISFSDRTQLGRKLDDLIKDVGDAEDLAPQFKLWLLARIRDIRQAVSEYEFVGNGGVEAAYEHMVGGILRRPDRRDALKRSSIFATLVGVVALLDLLLNGANNLRQLTQPPSPPPVVIEIGGEDVDLHGIDGEVGQTATNGHDREAGEVG